MSGFILLENCVWICNLKYVLCFRLQVFMAWLSHRQIIRISISLILLSCGICILLCLLWKFFFNTSMWEVCFFSLFLTKVYTLVAHRCIFSTKWIMWRGWQYCLTTIAIVEWELRDRELGIVYPLKLGVLFCHLMSVDPLHDFIIIQQYSDTSPVITPFSVRQSLTITLISFSFLFSGRLLVFQLVTFFAVGPLGQWEWEAYSSVFAQRHRLLSLLLLWFGCRETSFLESACEWGVSCVCL